MSLYICQTMPFDTRRACPSRLCGGLIYAKCNRPGDSVLISSSSMQHPGCIGYDAWQPPAIERAISHLLRRNLILLLEICLIAFDPLAVVLFDHLFGLLDQFAVADDQRHVQARTLVPRSRARARRHERISRPARAAHGAARSRQTHRRSLQGGCAC